MYLYLQCMLQGELRSSSLALKHQWYSPQENE
nr:MAG TPA: hypothetical protein [Caudoviricetes sp.]